MLPLVLLRLRLVERLLREEEWSAAAVLPLLLLATLSSMEGRNCAPPPPPDVPTCEAVVGLSESSCDRSEYELGEASLSLESAGLASGACC